MIIDFKNKTIIIPVDTTPGTLMEFMSTITVNQENIYSFIIKIDSSKSSISSGYTHPYINPYINLTTPGTITSPYGTVSTSSPGYTSTAHN